MLRSFTADKCLKFAGLF